MKNKEDMRERAMEEKGRAFEEIKVDTGIGMGANL